jgi:hypothetical protein
VNALSWQILEIQNLRCYTESDKSDDEDRMDDMIVDIDMEYDMQM